MNKINKILIIRLSSLGDIILTTPVIEAIRCKFPDANIYYLTKTEYRELLKANPYIDEIICVDTYDGIRGIYNLFKAIRTVRKMKIDIVIDLHFRYWSYLRIALWNFLLRNLIGVKNKIKYYRPPFKCVSDRYESKKHVIDLYFESLKKIGIDPDNRMPELFFLPSEKEWADDYLSSYNTGDNDLLIGICPGASYQTKQWGKENFRGVCNQLSRNPRIKLILFGEQSESDLIRYISKDMDLNKLIYAIGLSLRRVISLINRCKLVLTNDSALMHVASALKIPVVAIFGPTHPKLGYYPLGEDNVILYSNVPCSPCSRWGEKKCKYREQLCFDDTQIEDVMKALNSNLTLYIAREDKKCEFGKNLSYC